MKIKLDKSKIVLAIMILAFVLMTVVVLIFYANRPYPFQFQKEIVHASEKYDVSASLIASVINAESSYNTRAKSHRGAVGLMQLLPSTAEWICSIIGQVYDEEMLTNPLYNIELGSYYLHYLNTKFTEQNAVLASYNAGEGNVSAWLQNRAYSDDGETLKTTPFAETNYYIEKVKEAQKYYQKKFAT